MPAAAEILCQRCGSLTVELVASHGGRPVAVCLCGGVRQVVRILRHVDDHPLELERSVMQRSVAGPRG
jgi:hypothetical protein